MTAINARSVTIQDVARHAGVSRAAVSKVIRDAYGVSPEMRTRVQASIDSLGYRPRVSARAMRGATFTIGVEIPNVDNHFFTKVINGASLALSRTRYQLIIAPAAPDHDFGPQAIEVLADRQVDGIVAISPRVPPAWLEELAARTPLVMLGRHDDSASYDTVVADDAQGARLAVRHLYDLGHRRIVHLTQAENRDIPGTPHALRLDGYEAELRELGIEDSGQTLFVEPSQEAGREAALDVLAGGDGPVGIFAAHDELALGVLQAVAELGLTPGQASVVGYDDIEIAAHPRMSLTSINQSGTQMGQACVRLLLERIAGRDHAIHEVIEPRLVARGSSAPPPVPQP